MGMRGSPSGRGDPDSVHSDAKAPTGASQPRCTNRSFFKECVQIARAMEDAEDFDAGVGRQFPVEDEVVGKLRDDPRADVLVTAELAPSAEGGILRQKPKPLEYSLLDLIRGLRVVREDVGVDHVHIRHGLFRKNELSHGRGDERRNVGAGFSRRFHQGRPCLHRAP